ncbi:hypothetical protein [Flavobacterium reichenbachii]|uniref:Lipoprotein n=1 Tax=Flavobacterium reichenbachii TaxID=362418 RepID=A0A085ZGC6_9FLAO|nr:hypothetical protein [Flavobacterium reichenbachii]KFF03490.1 hypothetical protein IW19_21665 [Flavobacterium reichenbachii]OXB15687.1 hypothetical protein B0A68_09870 [Flavobacterium reichenbachii]
MKTKIAYLCILMLIISCKGKITNIKITPTENDKNYKCYMLNYGERPDIDFLQRDCPWIKDPANTVFIYMPICFKLKNGTGRDLRISKLCDNYSINQYHPMIVDNKYYEEANSKAVIVSQRYQYYTICTFASFCKFIRQRRL